MLLSYARRLQREDGVFVHFTDGRIPWGRGNGFAALGLTEALTSLPAESSGARAVLEIYRRHMNGMKAMQAPDGMWRQVVDEPGAYREESVTAMTLTAMARGIRLGWLDSRTYRPVVDRAWRALAAHITERRRHRRHLHEHRIAGDAAAVPRSRRDQRVRRSRRRDGATGGNGDARAPLT